MENPYQAPMQAAVRPEQQHLPPRTPSAAVRHVRLVAVFMAIEGLLECAVAACCFFFVAVLSLVGPEQLRLGEEGEQFVAVSTAIYVAAGSTHLVIGVLHLLAAYFNYRYRQRLLGIIALAVGCLSIFFGCCAPTSVGLAIYGLIIYFNDFVVQAFLMGENHYSVQQIKQTFY